MARPFREHHLLNLLEGYDKQSLPLDYWISQYFKLNKSLGSKDRAMITETVYGMVRWMGLLDYQIEGSPSWEKRYRKFLEIGSIDQLRNGSFPEHIQVSFPKVLYQLIVQDYGPEKAQELCLVSNTPAPTTVRANTLKISRDDLLKKWEGVYPVKQGKHSPNAIHFEKKVTFFNTVEFKEGFFEVQDEGSQLLADLVDPKPGDHVMDYCAGSGGKTLAFAPKLQHRGQIFLHDIRPWALDEAKKRLRRAGVQNAQVVKPESPNLKKLKGRMDWVLVDAPCTGTGTLRRNPEMKWKFERENVSKFVEQQREIFEKALQLMKPGGRIVYGTCSLFKDENEHQVDYFCEKHGLERVREDLHILPTVGGMDGFYGAVLEKK